MGSNQATAGVAWMILATVLYTAANLCVKALAHLPTEELVFLRSVISLILTGGWLWWKGYALFGVNRKWLLIRGIFGTIGLATFFHTLRFIPIASATVIQYLSPIFTVLLARYFDGQRSMKPLQWAFFGTAFAGVLMVKGFDPRINWFYFSLGVISAMAAAVAYLATMKCRETDHPVGVVIWFHLVAVPVTGSWTAFTWVSPEGHEWMLALAVGLLSVVAQVAMTFALHQGQANVIMPFKYFGAVLAFVFGLMLFDERLNAWALTGIAIVIASVTINTLMKRRWERVSSGSQLHHEVRSQKGDRNIPD